MNNIPVIVLVGRPNVGKSTLFNVLTRTRQALVANIPGLTRDRIYGRGCFEDRAFIVVDTGGIEAANEFHDDLVAKQSQQAIDEADIIIFMVDAKSGLTPGDTVIANKLRKLGKALVLAINKSDVCDPNVALAEFASLGFKNNCLLQAAHKKGVPQLMQHVFSLIKSNENTNKTVQASGIQVAIVGRPNVGKSTLTNRILGEERVIVRDEPGTTRDSIYIPFERFSKQYTIIDTAGLRKKAKVQQVVEKFSAIKTLHSIEVAHVVIVIISAKQGVGAQDLNLIAHVLTAGKSMILAVNKWDHLSEDEKRKVKEDLKYRLKFVHQYDLHFISALHGTNVGHLYSSIDQGYAAAAKEFSTSFLTRILEKSIHAYNPPLVRGRRIKLRVAHSGGVFPPKIIIHGKQTESVPVQYKRYLEKSFRKACNLCGTPVKLIFKTDENPFDN